MVARLSPLIIIACITLWAPCAALAQVRDIARHGAWTAYEGRSQDGTRLCGVVVDGAGGQSLHIKYFDGTAYLAVQAFKTTWRIPRGAEVPVRMAVDRHDGWVAAGIGLGNRVQWRLSLDMLEEFGNLFRAGLSLGLDFLAGNEAPWVASLRGSSAAFVELARCIHRLDLPGASRDAGAPTQPFSPSPMGQPMPATAPARRT